HAPAVRGARRPHVGSGRSEYEQGVTLRLEGGALRRRAHTRKSRPAYIHSRGAGLAELAPPRIQAATTSTESSTAFSADRNGFPIGNYLSNDLCAPEKTFACE